jgi:NAD(P)-dependent dehydrogenase (short-subunit alcohol dehydrogenase family)
MGVLASEPEEEQVEQLEGKVAVVTGAASGMGRAFAERFVQEGMKVVLADVEAGALETAVSELREAGGDVVGVRTDVSRLEEVEALAARTIDAFGAVHVVCNNAGVESGASFADIPAETWDWVLGVDLLGTIYGIKTFLPLLREHAPDGHIVNTSSIAGLDSYFLTAAPYVAAKHAVVGISEELFHELAAGNERIGVSVLCPGMIATQMPWSERNRPDHVPSSLDHPSRAQLIELTTMGAKNGMPPADVAELVVQAIRERRFYVLTHPEAAEQAAKGRLRWITENIPPEAPTFT